MYFRVAFCNMYYVNGIISYNVSERRFDPFLTFHVKPVGKKIHVCEALQKKVDTMMIAIGKKFNGIYPVSYTHLTLPTNREV